MSDESDKPDYEIGYGKPPVRTRFQKGHSGNPSGRPPGSKSWKTLLDEELNEKITVFLNGKKRKITKKRAVAKRAVHRALVNDDLKHLAMLGAFEEAAIQTERDRDDEFLDLTATLVFDGEPQQTYYEGELIRDHALDRRQKIAEARQKSQEGFAD